MAVKTRAQIVPTANRFQGSGTNQRRYLTIHQTDNFAKGANAAAHANLQSGGYKSASWHWQVDDAEAVQSYPESAIAWHAGDGGTGTGNVASIAIEMCVNSDSDYSVAFDNAAQLAAQILARNNIPLSRMVQHNYWTGKNCPSQIRNRGEWAKFRSLVEKYLTGKAVTPKPAGALAVDGDFGSKSVTRLQKVLGTKQTGRIGPQWVGNKKYHPALLTVTYTQTGGNGSAAVGALQKKLGVTADRHLGPVTIRTWQKKLGVAADGYFGAKSAKAAQRALNGNKLW